ncbi:hypothetical protein F4780DRAFT_721827 [Xylariomycetidae sp. FL0641]|nr:hypothetical protein F4780DRAFT_721827 [Xylariomycetidae sp. FL0641]
MKPSTSRLVATAASQLPRPIARQSLRPFSQTCRRAAEEPPRPPPPSVEGNAPAASAPSSGMADIGRIVAQSTMSSALNKPAAPSAASTAASILEGSRPGGPAGDKGPPDEPYHFHIYAHKHNNHITVTYPNRDAILSMSAGQIGFRKAKRGSYEAGHQLCSYILDKLNQLGKHREIHALEVVLRGFGQGREACTKVLLGAEGRMIRDKIIKVADATRIKFGGTRSKKPRRLG